MVRVAVLDLERRVAVVRAHDDGSDQFPHRLRGTLAGMLAVPTWHVVVAFMDDAPPSHRTGEVLVQAARWAHDGGCRLTVTSLSDLAQLAPFEP